MNPERSGCIEISVLPLRNAVVYPYMVIPLFAGWEKSIHCLETTMDHDKKVMLATQKETSTDGPGINDLFTVGTVASILQMLKLPNDAVKVLVEGLQHVHISALSDNSERFSAKAEYLESSTINEREQGVLVRTAISQFEGYIKLNKRIPPGVLTPPNSIDNPARLADTIAAHMPLKLADKQSVLKMPDVNERLEYLMAMMGSETDLLQAEKRIRSRIKKQVEKSQHGYYLNEQMRAIQKELGGMDDASDKNEASKRKIDAAKIPKEAKEKAEVGLQKLKMMSPMSAKATVVCGYIDWMVQMPWNARSKVKKDLRQTQEIPNTDHYGLEHVKDRIPEYLVVQSRVNKIKGSILCLVGPPGVGKASLGRSVAKIVGRKYIRMALGSVHDEAEIRGHHRIYIGSTPGKPIQKMVKVGVKNPLFLLDEIDKIPSDVRGDPASALLEVSDPEQNVVFSDYYLGVGYDLNDVVFVATSNFMNIPAPLLDRMEVIRPSGHTEDEKLNIAKRHLLPRQIERSTLKEDELTVDDSTIIGIIHYYIHKADVHGLKREISKLCRKAVKQLLLDKPLKHIEINGDNPYGYLGTQYFGYGRAGNENRIDQVTGLAQTEMDSDLLTIETIYAPREGRLTCIGSLSGVMQEFIQAALMVVRACAEKLGINPDFYERRDIHVHVPEGAMPKDGPSVGIAMCTVLVSCLTDSPVRADVAMTDKITSRGQVLPIDGLEERLLAAYRGGIRTVLIPFKSKYDLEEVPDNVIAGLDIHLVKRIEEVLALVLQSEPPGMQVAIARQ